MIDNPSTAIQLLDFVWNHRQESTSHSWLKINHCLREAVELAVRSGMAFNLDDIRIIFNRYRGGYWMGADTEWFYRLAVLYRHASAWKAYENYAGRTPFIVKDASVSTHTGDGPRGQGLARLIVGARFIWEGEGVTVTSFNDEKRYFNAYSYTRTEGVEVKTRYRITHADLSAAKKVGKKRLKELGAGK